MEEINISGKASKVETLGPKVQETDIDNEADKTSSHKKRGRLSGAQRRERKKNFSTVGENKKLKQEIEELKKRDVYLTQVTHELLEELDVIRKLVTDQNDLEEKCKSYAKHLVCLGVPIPLKVIGKLSKQIEKNYESEFTTKIYTNFIYQQSFYPFITETSDPLVLNENDPTYKAMKKFYPEEVLQDIIRATRETIKFGNPDRSKTILLWNETEQKEMDIGEIMESIYTFFSSIYIKAFGPAKFILPDKIPNLMDDNENEINEEISPPFLKPSTQNVLE